jgi:type IV pilus assembly protein PilX
MRKNLSSIKNASKQRGVVMVIALILLLILSLLGVTAARMQTVEERMARNDDNRQLGQQAAEAALRTAESGLLSGIIVNFAGNTNGLYAPVFSNGSPLTGMDWTVPANTFSYAGPPLTSLPAASQSPKTVIENMPSVAVAGEDIRMSSLNGPTPVAVYRVTAQGVGADGTSTSTLQTIVR